MSEWEELHCAPTLADRVLMRVRQRQAGRIAWTLGVTLLVAVAVALPLLWPSRDAGPATAASTRAPAATAGGIASVGSPVLERARIYAAALAGIAGPHRLVQVRDRACTDETRGPAGGCAGEVIPAAVVREVDRLLPGQVRFVAHPRNPFRSGDPALVTFGQLDITGDRASLRRELLCGSLCGQGETLILSRRDGQWQVTGRQGPDWVS